MASTFTFSGLLCAVCLSASLILATQRKETAGLSFSSWSICRIAPSCLRHHHELQLVGLQFCVARYFSYDILSMRDIQALNFILQDPIDSVVQANEARNFDNILFQQQEVVPVITVPPEIPCHRFTLPTQTDDQAAVAQYSVTIRRARSLAAPQRPGGRADPARSIRCPAWTGTLPIARGRTRRTPATIARTLLLAIALLLRDFRVEEFRP